MPEPVALLVVAATVGVAKATHDVVSPSLGGLSGHRHTKAGGDLMDKAIDILSDPRRAACMNPTVREFYLQDHQRLQPVRQSLEASTRTWKGSLWNSGQARTFHADARDLHTKTKIASDSTLVGSELHAARIEVQLQKEEAARAWARIQAQEEVQRQIAAQQQAEAARREHELQRRAEAQQMEAQRRAMASQQLSRQSALQGSRASSSSAEANLRTLLGPGGRNF